MPPRDPGLSPAPLHQPRQDALPPLERAIRTVAELAIVVITAALFVFVVVVPVHDHSVSAETPTVTVNR